MLAVTSVTLAAARGHAPAVGQMTLCVGGGMVMVAVDADGNPTAPPHVCPDGVAALVQVDMAAPAMPLRRMADGERLSLPPAMQLAAAQAPVARARAPPA